MPPVLSLDAFHARPTLPPALLVACRPVGTAGGVWSLDGLVCAVASLLSGGERGGGHHQQCAGRADRDQCGSVPSLHGDSSPVSGLRTRPGGGFPGGRAEAVGAGTTTRCLGSTRLDADCN